MKLCRTVVCFVARFVALFHVLSHCRGRDSDGAKCPVSATIDFIRKMTRMIPIHALAYFQLRLSYIRLGRDVLLFVDVINGELSRCRGIYDVINCEPLVYNIIITYDVINGEPACIN